MGSRFSKGTMDHDGDGKAGGSLSTAEAQRRAATQEENDMAKQPTAKNADKPAPSQPWVKPDAASAADAPATTGETETSTELPAKSEERDQVTPSGPNPVRVNAAAEAGTPDTSPNKIDAEAKDQVTPSGDDEIPANRQTPVDTHEALQARIEALDEDETVEFHSFMSSQAAAKLDQIEKGRKARDFEVNLVDPAEHYGNRIPAARRKELEA